MCIHIFMCINVHLYMYLCDQIFSEEIKYTPTRNLQKYTLCTSRTNLFQIAFHVGKETPVVWVLIGSDTHDLLYMYRPGLRLNQLAWRLQVVSQKTSRGSFFDCFNI